MRMEFLAIALAILSGPLVRSSDEEEDEHRKINEVVEPYFKAMGKKDIDEVMKLISVPWLSSNEQVIKDREELKKHIQEQLKTFDAKKWTGEIRSVIKYSEYKKDTEGDTQKKFIGLANRVLREEDSIVLRVDKEALTISYLLMRQDKGKWTIVSGPHRLTYLMVDNTIPQEILDVLKNAKEIELHSLNPTGLGKVENLGKTTIQAEDTRKKLISEFQRGVEDSQGVGALCFNPRHSITAKHNNKTIELIVCFECLQVRCRMDGKDIRTLYIDSKPQKLFDGILKDANVKLAPKPEK